MRGRFEAGRSGNDRSVIAGRASASFKGWQWAEIVLVIFLIWIQILLQVVLNRLLISGLVALLLLGLLVHVASWIIPMARARRTAGSGPGCRPPRTPGAALGDRERHGRTSAGHSAGLRSSA
jgi:hypothetical protein